jgi:ABC-2 type transport system ATP-binding protein
MDLITTQDLSKRYRRTLALRDLSIAVPAGGVTALVGPNGAGKSTLLKLCVGFERPTRGGLRVLGVDPVRDRAGAVAGIGYVPQAPSLYRELSAGDHLQLASSLRTGFDANLARERLRMLGIPLGARPRELSGGQQAQISLAIALGTRASLLLLDEPLANLDPLARREFLHVVREAVAGGDVSAILSSHVIADVEPVCDQLLVLGEGSVLLQDTVAGATASHRVTARTAPERGRLVALFPDRAGVLHRLERVDPGDPIECEPVGREPSLEEVVLGYLASARIARVEAA